MEKKFEWTMISAIGVSVLAVVAVATFFSEKPENRGRKVGIEGTGNIISIEGDVDGNITLTGANTQPHTTKNGKPFAPDKPQPMQPPKDPNATKDSSEKLNRFMRWGEKWGEGALAP